MQLSGRLLVAGTVVALCATAAPVLADGELSFATAYYKERATRVMQPMLDGRFDVGDHGEAKAHMLVDAITSASVGVGEEVFDETRVEGGVQYTHEIDIFKIGGLFRYSTEPDYRSVFGGLRFQAELFDRNLTLSAAATIGHDNLSNEGAPPMAPRLEGELDTKLASFGAAQLLTPNAIASVTYDLTQLDGEQANLYRYVITAGMQIRENHPDKRTRHAVAGTVKWFLPGTATTLIASYRRYFDSWKLKAHTPELRLIQELGDSALFAVRYRYHRQGKAYFYEGRYAGPQELISADVKLSVFDSHTISTTFEVTGDVIGFTGFLGETRGQIIFEYVDQNNGFGHALIGHATLTVPLTY
ncbi:MAG TPA: DUF3570 domain-containing protein [Kofleriaceae bacterium]|nr:DUF3570 domain-containing protein [Kofleriaceae bacterium]